MKKGLRIVGILIGVVLLLLLGILVAFQSPKVQTALGKRIVASFENKIDGKIEFESIKILPFNAIHIDGVTVTDSAPYKDTAGTGGLPVVDTLLKAGSLSATLSLKGLFDKTGVHIKHLKASGLEFNLTIEPSDSAKNNVTTNLERIFRIKDDNDSKPIVGDIFDINKAEVKNARYRMVNYVNRRDNLAEGNIIPPTSIDLDDLDLVADLKARNIRLRDGITSGTVDELKIKEKSSFAATVSGKTHVGKGNTTITSLRIKDKNSDVHAEEFTMDYDGVEAFSNFLEEVKLGGKVISPTILDSRTLAYFVPALTGKSFRTMLKGEIGGYVSNFRIPSLTFQEEGSKISGNISGSLKGLPDVSRLSADVLVNNLTFTSSGVSSLLEGFTQGKKIDLGKLAKGETFTFSGTGKGPLNNLAVTGNLNSYDSGSASLKAEVKNLTDKSKPTTSNGDISTDRLDIGRLIGNDKIGGLTLESSLGATLENKGPKVDIKKLNISRLNALGYNYSDIVAEGTYSGNEFDGRIVCTDPNLKFVLEGLFNLSPTTENAAYQFYANVGYADLNAIGIDKRGKSKVSLEANANFMYANKEDILGDIIISDFILENSEGRRNVGDISIQSHANDNINRVRFNSSFADGSYVSTKPVTAIAKDLRKLIVDRELPSIVKNPDPTWDGTPYEIAFKMHDSRNLLSFMVPGLYIANNTNLRFNVDEAGKIDGNLVSQRLAFNDKYIKDLSLSLGNDERGGLTGTFNSSEVAIGGFSLKNGNGSVAVNDDNVGATFTFDNGEKVSGNLNLGGRFSRDDKDVVSLTGRALPSSFNYNGKIWNLSSSDIIGKEGSINVSTLKASCEDQTISIDGGLSGSDKDTLSIRMEKFDISMINNLIPIDFDLKGRATGRARITSPSKPTPGILLGIVCDSTYVGGAPMGLLRMGSIWDEESKSFKLVLRNELGGTSNLDVNGFLTPSTKEIGIHASLDDLNLAYAAPALNTIFSEFGGRLDGTIDIKGKTDKPIITSDSLRINQGLLRVGFTNVAYIVDGPVSLDSEGLLFLNDNVTDGLKGKATLSGGIFFKDFKDPSLNINIGGMRNMHAIDLSAADNDTFYGNIFANGSVKIKGPFDNIVLTVDGTTAGDGELHIPLGGGITNKSADILTFYEPAKEIIIDPYEAMMNRITEQKKKASRFGVNLRVRATPDVTAFVEIGNSSGNVLSGQGSGLIEIETVIPDNTFTINGDYALSSGNFKVSALGLVTKDFSLQDGSSIRFNGDIMDSDLNIDGLYTTKTSLANLISDSTAVATRRTVNCGIKITDKLRNPEIKFSIDIPDLDPTTQSMVESALNTDDKIQKQFLYLLLSGSFLPTEESGIVNNSSEMLYSNVSSIMAGQLNNIFEMLNIPLDLGLNYQETGRGTSIFDVALSTQLLNNRIVVNGNIGNRRTMSGVTTEEVVGDVDVEYKVDKNGTFRLKAFSHSADQYTSYLDNSQRNGVGVSIQREFNTFGDFFRSLFRRRRDPDELSPVRQGGSVTITVDSEGNPEKITSNE